jgi:hypothetical protein
MTIEKNDVCNPSTSLKTPRPSETYNRKHHHPRGYHSEISGIHLHLSSCSSPPRSQRHTMHQLLQKQQFFLFNWLIVTPRPTPHPIRIVTNQPFLAITTFWSNSSANELEESSQKGASPNHFSFQNSIIVTITNYYY